MARQAHYCTRIADRICEEVAIGKSVKAALKAAGPLAPTLTQFWRWLGKYPDLKVKYEEALRFQANANADTMLDLASMAIEMPSKASAIKVAVDILKWHAEMRDPATYSPKAAQSVPTPPKTLKQMQEEVEKLQRELGVDVQPGMVTAPRVLRALQSGDSSTPAPTPNLKVVGE